MPDSPDSIDTAATNGVQKIPSRPYEQNYEWESMAKESAEELVDRTVEEVAAELRLTPEETEKLRHAFNQGPKFEHVDMYGARDRIKDGIATFGAHLVAVAA